MEYLVKSETLCKRIPKTLAELHAHTEYSLLDGSSKIKDRVARSKELGKVKVCITDHGRLTGVDDLTEAVRGQDILPMYGVEAYLRDPLTQRRAHLVLYAKDNIGYQQLTMALARGEFNEDGESTLSDEHLEMLKGGHIIATSACIEGVFGSIKMFNKRLNKRIAEWTERQEEFKPAVAEYEVAAKEQKALESQLVLVKKELSDAKKASKTSFVAKKKHLAGRKTKLEKAQAAFDKYVADGTDKSAKAVRTALAQFELTPESVDEFEDCLERAQVQIQQEEARLASEELAIKDLTESLPTLEAKVADTKAALDHAKEKSAQLAKQADKFHQIQNKIDELKSQLLSDEEASKHFRQRLKLMIDTFPGDFYIEVQNHGMPEEREIYSWLYDVAKHCNLPLVAANDSHVVYPTEEEFTLRQIRRSCRFNKWEESSDSDREMYMKTDEELAMALLQILPEDAVIEAMENVNKIVNACNVVMKKESHAPKAAVENVTETVTELARANIEAKYGSEWGEKHEERLKYEMDIISKMGFSDYFYITQDIIEAARKIGALSYDKLNELKATMDNMTMDELMDYLEKYGTEVNLSVGLGRGSGAGSIVCYLLGITNIDPFKYDLLFEREKDCVH